MNTHRINLSGAYQYDDESLLAAAACKAIGAIFAAFLALTLASVGVLLYVLATGKAASEQPRIELLGGQCSYSEVGDGIWWNSNYPHTLDLTSNCYQLGVSKRLWKAGIFDTGLRAAYVNLGSIYATAVYPMRDEEQFTTKPNGEHCDPTTWHGCVGKGYGRQQAEGVSLGYIVEDVQGPITWGAEAGLFAYYSSWEVNIEAYPDKGQFAPVYLKWSGWQATPYFGFNARYKYLFGQFKVYGSIKAAEHGCGGCSGVTTGPATQVSVGLSVPF